MDLTFVKGTIKIHSMGTDRVTLKIPRPLYERVKTIIEGSGFSSVNEFVVYILRDLLSTKDTGQRELTAKEVKAIRQRLKTLGYF